MTSKSKVGGRRDKHPPSPDAANKKARKAERVAKGKYQTKLKGAQSRDAQDTMRRLLDDWGVAQKYVVLAPLHSTYIHRRSHRRWLMSYGPNSSDLFWRAGDYGDKILRGMKPADIPVEQPTKFDLVVNLRSPV
jgi:hypothetical protein